MIAWLESLMRVTAMLSPLLPTLELSPDVDRSMAGRLFEARMIRGFLEHQMHVQQRGYFIATFP